MNSPSDRVEAARAAGRRLARAPGDQRRAAAARFLELLDPQHRPEGLTEPGSVADRIDPLGRIVAVDEARQGFHRVRVRRPAGLVLAPGGLAARLCVLSMLAGDGLLVPGEGQGPDGIVGSARQALTEAGLPTDAIAPIEMPREDARPLGPWDVLVQPGAADGQASGASDIPRKADGVCHTYVDGTIDTGDALAVCIEAKRGEPSQARTDTYLVHEAVAGIFVPALGKRLGAEGLRVEAGEVARRRTPGARPASASTWETSEPDRCGIRVVGSLSEAIEHVDAYGPGLAQATLTQHTEAADNFLRCLASDHVVLNGPTTVAGHPDPEQGPRVVAASEVSLEDLTRQRTVHAKLEHGKLEVGPDGRIAGIVQAALEDAGR